MDSFPFLQLPPELRHMVYDVIFSSEEQHIQLMGNEFHPSESTWNSLKQVSREVRAESLPLYYSVTTFCFNLHEEREVGRGIFYGIEVGCGLNRWLARLTPQARVRVRKVELVIGWLHMDSRQLVYSLNDLDDMVVNLPPLLTDVDRTAVAFTFASISFAWAVSTLPRGRMAVVAPALAKAYDLHKRAFMDDPRIYRESMQDIPEEYWRKFEENTLGLRMLGGQLVDERPRLQG